MKDATQWLKHTGFAFILPLFFVFHNWVPHAAFISGHTFLELILQFELITLLIFLAALVCYRQKQKAALAGFALMSVYFFYGALQDFSHLRYAILIPVLLLLLTGLFAWLRKHPPSKKLIRYLYVLLSIWIIADLCLLLIRPHQKEQRWYSLQCDSCAKPDIYLVMADGFAGSDQLKKDFRFDNSAFRSSLEKLGFYVMDSSRSNYSSTPFSMSSLLNARYLHLPSYEYTDTNLDSCYRYIYQSGVVSALKQAGYQFYNYSIFDIAGEEAPVDKHFLQSGQLLITAQTFGSRFRKDVLYNLLSNYLPRSSWHLNMVMSEDRNNMKVEQLTIHAPVNENPAPRFVYTHLMMPHFPYYYNARGERNKLEDLMPSQLENDNLYLGYLQYAGNRLVQIVQKIKNQTGGKAVILLLSDHGYRKNGGSNSTKFSNLGAVYLPAGNYSNYRKDLSLVNQFPVLFNSIFKAGIPLQPDRVVE